VEAAAGGTGIPPPLAAAPGSPCPGSPARPPPRMAIGAPPAPRAPSKPVVDVRVPRLGGASSDCDNPPLPLLNCPCATGNWPAPQPPPLRPAAAA